MNKIKRVVYVICFACVMLIDWSRGSASWECWATLINLVSVLMSVVMACTFSWKDQYAKGGPWKRYVIWFVLWLVGSVVGYKLWSQNPDAIFPTQYLTAALGVLCLGVIALRIWTSRKALKGKGATFGNPLLLAVWVIMTVLMLCSPLGEIWQLYYLVIFAMFYYVPYGKKERELLWISVADGVILGFFVIQTWAYGFRPYDEAQYSGAYANTNMTALFYLVTYICVFYRLHYLWYKKKQGEVKRCKLFALAQFLLCLLAAGLCSFMLMTGCRTAVLIAAVATVVYVVFELCLYQRLKFHKIVLCMLAYGVCMMCLFPCVYATVRYLPTILHHPVWLGDEYSDDKIHSYDPVDSDKYTEFDELLEMLLQRFAGIQVDIDFEREDTVSIPDAVPMQGVLTIMPVEYLTQLPGVRMVLTAPPDMNILLGEQTSNTFELRISMWKAYLKNLNFIGHELEDGYFQITEYYHAWHTQNVFVQVLFYYGIPAGILFIVLMVALGIQALRIAVKNRSVEAILPLLVWTVFIGYGLSECVWYMGQSILFLMYLTPKILIDSRKRRA